MNSIDQKSYNKPTLGSILTEANSQSEKLNNPQHLNFPKINTNLKKTNFTKYRSAFLPSQQTTKALQSPLLENYSQKKISTEFSEQKQKDREFLQNLNRRKWKLNQKRGHKLNFFSIKTDNSHNLDIAQPQNNTNKLYSPRHFNIDANRFLITQAVRQTTPQKIGSQVQKIRLRSKEQINDNIKRSNRMISLIKEKCKQEIAKRSASTRSPKDNLSKPDNLGLFSYLHREFVINKASPQKLNEQKINEYFKHPSNPKLQQLVNFKSRKFLKNKMFNDYKNSHQVKQYSSNLSKEGILKQIEQKNQKYHSDYKKRISIPYFSFLSLPRAHQQNVIESICEKA